MSENEEKPSASAEDTGGEATVSAETTTTAEPEKEKVETQVSETQAAKDRFAAIMASDAAQGRTKAAVRLATKTDMSAEDVIATLNELPAEAKGPSKLDAAMENVGGSGVVAEGESAEKSDSETILGDYQSARGKKAVA